MDTTVFNIATNNVTTMWGILLYWLPLAFCAFGYVVRTADNVQKDLEARDKHEKAGTIDRYVPTDTIGTLIGRAIVSLLPVANLLAACFDVGPKIFGKFFAVLGRVFNQPLVPKR